MYIKIRFNKYIGVGVCDKISHSEIYLCIQITSQMWPKEKIFIKKKEIFMGDHVENSASRKTLNNSY